MSRPIPRHTSLVNVPTRLVDVSLRSTLVAVGRPLLAALLLVFTANAASAAIAVDVNVFKDQSNAATTVPSPALSTTAANELLLAFISADYSTGTNTIVSSVSGGGLTWVLVKRTNVQSGTAEIWRAFATSTLSNVTITATLSKSVAGVRCSTT